MSGSCAGRRVNLQQRPGDKEDTRNTKSVTAGDDSK